MKGIVTSRDPGWRVARRALGAALAIRAALGGMPCAPQPAPYDPACSIRRVAAQRPATDGSFAPDGERFVFVHSDQLWLASTRGATPRRIGAPAVDNVYRARWVSDSAVLVSQVMPGEGDVLGVLDLARGRFGVVARGVREDAFCVSRYGGLLACQATAQPGEPGTTLVGVVAAGGPGLRRLAGVAHARLVSASPSGSHLAGISDGGRAALWRAGAWRQQALDLRPGRPTGAPAWAPDGSAVAFLLAPEGASPTADTSAAIGAPAASKEVVVVRAADGAQSERGTVPPQCEAIRWDAEGRGLLCWAEGLDGGLWYWPRADSRAVRRLHHAGVSDIAPLQGGYVLAVVPIPGDARRRGHLHLLHTDGTFSKRITGTPSFDRICDVSPDYRRVLLARSPCDDRGELRPDATLWLLEVRQEK